MRSPAVTYGTSAILLLGAGIVEAKHGHAAAHDALKAIHKRHSHHRAVERSANESLTERDISCSFPTNLGLVSVSPNLGNGGWAFAPDQSCYPGRYCPYACPPGQVSMQWDPEAIAYTYPLSRNGGLLCGNDGQVTKPFPDRPYCQETAQNIGVQNNCGEVVTFCQTVLPGDEDMLIPTAVNDFANLAVPDPNYWASTSAHYYINPPGTGPSDACVWGSLAKPLGNWSPYVAGANSDATGQTFLKLGWNPIYLETATPFRDEMPNWGVKIECPDGNCNGLPCAIDPTKNVVNTMLGSIFDGAGGGAFCVVTVPAGSKANFVVFNAGEEDKAPGQFYQSSSTQPAAAPTTTATLASTSNSTTTTTPASIATSSSTNTTTASPSTSPTQLSYYDLFNTSSTSAAQISPSAVAAQKSPATSTPAVQSKNTASHLQVSSVLFLVAFSMSLL